MSVDLAGLPDVSFADTDTARVEAAIITLYEGITNTTLFPGNPVRLFLSTLAAIIAQRNSILDYTGKQNLLRYAHGAFLDHLGALLQVVRLDAVAAKTTIHFTLQEVRPTAVLIPAGTRVTADTQIYFATDALLVIPPGQMDGEVAATCQSLGRQGNGFLEGQINKLVDPLPFVSGVENTKASSGGADIEDDESLRNRIRLQPESFTTAGSELAYVYWALSAHTDVMDVSVMSPLPGYVNLFVLLQDGRIPELGGPEIEAVVEAVSAIRRRPLTDFVTVMPVDDEAIDYTLQWFITPSQSARVTQIQAGIEAAVAEYEAWQTNMVGRDVVPDRLISLCQGAGAKRVVLDGLNFTVLDPSRVVQFIDNHARIQFGGVEDE